MTNPTKRQATFGIRLLFNPQSFTPTVEKILHFSFLVKLERVSIWVVEDDDSSTSLSSLSSITTGGGGPMICPTCKTLSCHWTWRVGRIWWMCTKLKRVVFCIAPVANMLCLRHQQQTQHLVQVQQDRGAICWGRCWSYKVRLHICRWRRKRDGWE